MFCEIYNDCKQGEYAANAAGQILSSQMQDSSLIFIIFSF